MLTDQAQQMKENISKFESKVNNLEKEKFELIENFKSRKF
jgi:hypothetical protein